MGKDQELLDAARNGSLAVVEKILSQRAKRSGPLASLRRGPGVNVSDNSGYTPLHHSALNGHKDIVILLLAHDASPNTTDHKGSSPLHLAAWTGNTEIVKLLLVQSNVQPNVNLTNRDGETPLHCAAQYGHADVVSLLQQHNCDPSIRNLKEETPLDLAAQYGRLETVEILVKTHPELLASGQQTRRHSALHLASRNGHSQVVQVLLSSGFPINALTDSGSALHEASTFGKLDVVRLLLDSGIDLEAEDQRRRTAMDILEDLKSHKSQEIASVIQSHGTLITTVDYDIRNANPTKRQLVNRSYENVVLPKWASVDGRHLPTPTGSISSSHSPSPTPPVYQDLPKTPRSVSVDLDRRRSSGKEVYQVPPTPEPLESSFEGSDLSGTSVYQTPPPPRELDAMSIGSSYYETPPTPRDVIARGGQTPQRTSLPEGDSSLIYQVPPPPREVLKRMSDPSNTMSGSGSLLLRTFGGADSNRDGYQRHNAGGYMSMFPTTSKCLRPPQKPPRKTLSPHSPTKFEVQSGPPGVAYEYLCLATTGSPCDDRKDASESRPSLCDVPPPLQASRGVGDYVDMKVRHSFVLSADNEFFKEWKKRSRGFANLEDDERSGCRSSRRHPQQQHRQIGPASYENVVRTTTMTTTSKRRTQPRTGGGTMYANVKSSDFAVGGHESDGGERLQKPRTLDFQNKRRSWDGERKSAGYDEHGADFVGFKDRDDGQPLSPTGYKQPPTPDFPPPSPGTAELGIHEKMRPLSQEYKRRSRDNETLTEDEVFQLIQDQDGITLQIVTTENKSVSTENIELVRGDAPFAGLQRGSKPLSCSSDDSCPEMHVRVHHQSGGHHPHHQQQQQQQQHHHQRSNSEPRWEVSAPKADRRPAVTPRPANVYENYVKAADMSTASSQQRYLSGKAPPPQPLICASSSTPSPYENVNIESLISPFDENAEWAKINDIMATFGGSVLRPPINSPLYREMEDELINRFHLEVEGVRWQLSPVGQWLSKLECGEYENHFLANGFDDLQFMGGSMLDDQDLMEMGIANAAHRKLILEAAKSLPAVQPVNGATPPDTVDAWLARLHLESYAETFHKHKYCDMERIMKMWEVELTTVLEITLPGHKKRILASLGVRPIAPCVNGSVNDLNSDLSNLKHEINQLDQMGKKGESNPNGTLRRRNGHKQPAPPPPPPLPTPRQTAAVKSPDHANGNKDIVSEFSNGGGVGNYQNGMEGITIRDPCQLFSGIPTSLTTQWKHKPEAFIVGACNYTAKYLGSTLVKELKGVESSKKSIQRLKKSTNEIAKVPNVILSISYKGVKFIDAHTKYEVCEHEIRNINCACQDADDLNHFAYITKDHQTGNHYCHVFSVVTMDMATEIILTLGQAFEVAYQVAIREKNLQASNNKCSRKPSSGSVAAAATVPPLVSPKEQHSSTTNKVFV